MPSTPNILPEVFIPIRSLLPLKSALTKVDTLRTLSQADLDEVPAIEAVLYGGDPSDPTYLIADGHHRASNALMQGQDVVRGMIASEDEHLAQLGSTALIDCHTIEAFHARYRREWLPHLQSLGITSLYELRYPYEARDFWQTPLQETPLESLEIPDTT